MIFGDLVIPVKAVRSLPRQRGWSYASQDVIDGPPRKQFVAPGAEQRSMSLFLHADFCNPKAVIDALVAMADAHEPYVLQSESGLVHGQYVIEAVNDDPRWTLPDGTIVAATVELSLSDPGLDELLAASKPKPLATSDNAVDVQGDPAAEDRTRPPGDVPPAEIARR